MVTHIRIVASLAAASTMLILGTCQALACGGPLDVACNVGKAIEKGAQDTGKALGKAGKDAQRGTSDTLNRIDPRITQMGRNIDNWRLNLQSTLLTGPLLEQWFIQSRNDALPGSQPIPPAIRASITGWYDESLLNSVRYKVQHTGSLNLANAAVSLHDVQAITLIDVIVFANPNLAASPDLWIHELKHVQQFRDWGVHSFAVQYMRSWNDVEGPAYAIANEYDQRPGPRAIASSGGMQLGGKCFLGPAPENFCWLPQSQSINTGCSCPTPNGALYGIVQ